MKTKLITSLTLALLCTACRKKTETSSPATPPPKPPAQAMASLSGLTETPPPPPTVSTAFGEPVVAAAPTAATPAGDTDEIAPSGLNDLERLNWALGVYFANSEAPAIKTLDPLMQAGLIKKIPQAPAGLDYVIDMSRLQVRLEKRN
ncbi:MAG: hypothetical protein AB1705_10750 [Verrucomicrobiota bacterium]